MLTPEIKTAFKELIQEMIVNPDAEVSPEITQLVLLLKSLDNDVDTPESNLKLVNAVTAKADELGISDKEFLMALCIYISKA